MIKDTQDIRDRMNKVLERIEAKTISASEAKLQISVCRTMLDSLKVDIAAAHLAHMPDSVLTCPSVAQLCRRAGEPDRLARIARDHDDLVNFTAARLDSARGS